MMPSMMMASSSARSVAVSILKGSGWYETDFKKGNQKNVAKEDSAPASESKSTTACDSAGGCGACAAPAATG